MQMMFDELDAGGKIYLVYPVIEQSEQLPQLRAASADLEDISQRFKDYNCGLLHGKMKSDEKDEALRRFRSGDTNILLSTQVIEIGVDVPDASMMVVMNAERFGMAQLHQLRGRVGRGVRKSRCILLASTASSLTRLKVLENSTDGFHLANMDLLLRGPGDLLGKRQSGHLPEFPIARLEIDGNILQDAHHAVLVSICSINLVETRISTFSYMMLSYHGEVSPCMKFNIVCIKPEMHLFQVVWNIGLKYGVAGIFIPFHLLVIVLILVEDDGGYWVHFTSRKPVSYPFSRANI